MIEICCIVDWAGRTNARTSVSRAVDQMRPADRHVADIVLDDPPICVGGVRCGHSTDAWKAGHREVVLHGQVCHPGLAGPDGRVDVDRLFAEPPDGLYNLLVWDRADQSLSVLSDAIGAKPLYYWRSDSIVVLTSQLKTFRNLPFFSPRLDAPALAACLVVGNPYDLRTLVEGVQVLPAARTSLFRHGRFETKARRLVRFTDSVRKMKEKDLLARFDDCMEQSTRQWLDPDPEATIALTGGVDSRVVLGYAQRVAASLTAVTFGDPHEEEVACAAQAATLLDIPHRVARITRASEIPEYQIRDFAWATGWVNGGLEVYWPTFDKLLRETDRPVLSGWFGSPVCGRILMGTGLNLSQLSQPAGSVRSHLAARASTQCPRILLQASTPAFARNLTTDLGDTFAALYDTLPGDLSYQRLMLHNFVTRQRRHVSFFINLPAVYTRVAVPFYTTRCLDFCLNLPVRQLRWRRLERRLLWDQFPSLARLRQRDQERLAGWPTGVGGILWEAFAGWLRRLVPAGQSRRRKPAPSYTFVQDLITRYAHVYAAGIRRAAPLLAEHMDVGWLANLVTDGSSGLGWPMVSRIHHLCTWATQMWGDGED